MPQTNAKEPKDEENNKQPNFIMNAFLNKIKAV